MDKKLFDLIKKEEKRQREQLQMIPSENYASKDVLNPLSSILSNKYAEGQIGKRYYQGNSVIDEIEALAVERAKKLFNCAYANVQPLSGTPMNLAVYYALLKPRDKILFMDLASGGHLSHGSALNIVSLLYKVTPYFVDEKTNEIKYEEVLQTAKREKPKMIICGASAYPRTIDFEKFSKIAKEVNAFLLADISHIAGLVASGVHPSPFPFADVVTTTTHKTLRGPRGGLILSNNLDFSKQLDKGVFPGVQAGPHLNTIASKAVCFAEGLESDFKIYSKQIVKNAKILSEELINYNFNIITGGTDNHLLLIDITNFLPDGKVAAEILERANIIVNYNMIPFDNKTPGRPSGIRLGTPALTSRGMKEADMKKVAAWINEVLKNAKNEQVIKKVGAQVKSFAKKFVVPGVDD